MNIVIIFYLSVLLLLSELASSWGESIDLHPPMITSRHADRAVSFRMTGLYQIGVVSFQSIIGYSVESDEDMAIYINSPDGEFGVLILPVSKEYFKANMVPYPVGGRFPEESMPVEMFYYLGNENIQLESFQPYWHQGFQGYRREFRATSIQGDLMEGEYIFY